VWEHDDVSCRKKAVDDDLCGTKLITSYCFGRRNLLELACVSNGKRTIKGRFLRDKVDKIGTCFAGRIVNKKTCSCFTSSTKRRLVWDKTVDFGTVLMGRNYL